MFDQVRVLYYGERLPLTQLAAITMPETQQILIKPFDQAIIKEMVSAINSARLGFNANNEGHQIRILIPPLTAERRKELVKQVDEYTEKARIGVRAVRQKFNKLIKSDENVSEDEVKYNLEQVQKLIDQSIQTIGALTEQKEQELVTI
ncbi:ribosome recycling factor [Mycoplasma sp. ATU-Cv-508]|uniref:ribosome recycling factor n=1 Tax=Mycoplasma sp. ATU-Cv-508 TaxID=2048001 RepID=UPI000FDF0A20